MVRLERESLNSLLEALEEWNNHLEQANIDPRNLPEKPEQPVHPTLKGPSP